MRSLSAIEQELILVCILINLAREIFKRIFQANTSPCNTDFYASPCRNCGHNDVDGKWIDIVWIASKERVDERHFRMKVACKWEEPVFMLFTLVCRRGKKTQWKWRKGSNAFHISAWASPTLHTP
jgi:hypothetical protein